MKIDMRTASRTFVNGYVQMSAKDRAHVAYVYVLDNGDYVVGYVNGLNRLTPLSAAYDQRLWTASRWRTQHKINTFHNDRAHGKQLGNLAAAPRNVTRHGGGYDVADLPKGIGKSFVDHVIHWVDIVIGNIDGTKPYKLSRNERDASLRGKQFTSPTQVVKYAAVMLHQLADQSCRAVADAPQCSDGFTCPAHMAVARGVTAMAAKYGKAKRTK